MINPYVGEVSCFGFDWAPEGWLPCQGQLVSVQAYSQLFAVIGKTFGGDGLATFGLPKFEQITTDGGWFCMSAFGAPPVGPRNALPAEATIFPSAPAAGWIEARGDLLKIAEHQALFSILGTTFGGDGKTTFAVPDMFQLPPFDVPGNYGYCLYYIANAGTTDQGFIGEIKIFPTSAAPNGWLPCNGQLLSISGNTAMYALLGTTYGGDAKTTFGLPNVAFKYEQNLQAFICQLGAFPSKP